MPGHNPINGTALMSTITAFWRGASEPSLAASVGALGVMAGLFGLCVLMDTTHGLARLDPDYLKSSHADRYVEVSFETLRIANTPTAPFAVAYFGTSGTVEVISDEREIERGLTEELGKPVPVYFLVAGGMNVIEMAGVMDLIGNGFNGVVLLQVGPVSLAYTPAKYEDHYHSPRFAFTSAVYDQEMNRIVGETPTRIGHYFLDHWQFFSARVTGNLLSSLVLGPRRFPRHAHVDGRLMNPQQWDDMIARARVELTPYHDQRDRNAAIIDRLIDRARQKGNVEVVLLEMPAHSDVYEQFAPPGFLDEHQQYMEAWGQRKGVHYWDLNPDAAWGPEDFFDYVHVRRADAQERYTRLLTQRLRQLVRHSQVKPTS